MKVLKRITAGLLTIGMVFSFAACGGNDTEQTLVMSCDQNIEGIPVTDTMTMNAIGDKVQTQQEVMVFNLSGYGDEEKEAFAEAMTAIMTSSYGSVDGVTVNTNTTDTGFSITISFDYAGGIAAMKAAGIIDSGLFESDNDYISLKMSRQALEAQGYKVVE